MWMRAPGALSLSLWLLLASMVGLAGHEHAAGVEHGAAECALDHESAHGPRVAGSGPELEAGGERHQHHCPGCRHGGHRSALTAPPPSAEPGPEAEATRATSSSPRLSAPTAGGSPRGPPTA